MGNLRKGDTVMIDVETISKMDDQFFLPDDVLSSVAGKLQTIKEADTVTQTVSLVGCGDDLGDWWFPTETVSRVEAPNETLWLLSKDRGLFKEFMKSPECAEAFRQFKKRKGASE